MQTKADNNGVGFITRKRPHSSIIKQTLIKLVGLYDELCLSDIKCYSQCSSRIIVILTGLRLAPFLSLTIVVRCQAISLIFNKWLK